MSSNILSKVMNKYLFFSTIKSRSRICRYAFIVHRTFRDAQYNLQQPIDYNVLGPKCYIEYANDYPASSYNYHNYDRKTIMVSRIPDDVSKNDLYRLFIGCRTIKYYSARYVHRAGTTMAIKNEKKLLLG